MRDVITLEGLRVECIVGDLPHERIYPQELFLDMALTCDLSLAAKSDLLADTINYVAVIDAVRERLVTAKCQMIERAAQVAIEAAFSVDARVLAVEVTVRKPHALPGVVAGVRLSRERTEV